MTVGLGTYGACSSQSAAVILINHDLTHANVPALANRYVFPALITVPRFPLSFYWLMTVTSSVSTLLPKSLHKRPTTQFFGLKINMNPPLKPFLTY